MISAGDVQYEPNQMKIGQFTDTTMIVVAGDFGTHSEAVKDTYRNITPTHLPENIAKIYAQSLQKIRRREAEDLYLAPLGLNTDTFLVQQKDMSDRVVSTLVEQLQNHRGQEVEALIAGTEVIRGIPSMRLFSIDTHGVVTCCDDVGFAAIGSGGWHARSSLMQARYSSDCTFARALALTFAAKKAAEVAPGVGRHTDLHIALRHKIEAVDAGTAARLNEIYTNPPSA
jgi:20S proteasome alpha/beta subunit